MRLSDLLCARSEGRPLIRISYMLDTIRVLSAFVELAQVRLIEPFCYESDHDGDIASRRNLSSTKSVPLLVELPLMAFGVLDYVQVCNS